MKRISGELFFAVLWKGLTQCLGAIFELFGFKRKGKFARCLWGIFATSGTIVMTLFALALLCCLGESVYNRYFRNHYCDDEYCYHSEYVNRDIYFHELSLEFVEFLRPERRFSSPQELASQLEADRNKVRQTL